MIVSCFIQTILLFIINSGLCQKPQSVNEKLDIVHSPVQYYFKYGSIFNQSTSVKKNFRTLYDIQSILQPHFGHIDYYLPKSQNVSENCARDLEALGGAFAHPETLFNENLWVLLMIDSWGKFEDGILQGNRLFLGFFDECLNVQIADSNSKGRYCLMSYGSDLDQSSANSRMPIMLFPSLNIPVASYYATCIPSSCTQQELMISVGKEMDENGLILKSVECQSSADEIHFDSAEIFGIVFFSFMAFILLSASLLDISLEYFGKENLKKSKIVIILLAFSVPKNMKKIFHVETKNDPNVISCIHGLRFLSICLVIIGHQCYYTIKVSPNDSFIKMTQVFLIQIISNGDKAVDTFFTITGLLVSYNFFTHSFRTKKFPLVKFYLLRFLRLTPPILTCVIFFATVAGLVIYGPLAVMYKDDRVEACQTFWWIDWTYATNFVFRFGISLIEKTGESYSCVPQSWFLSVDTQLYIVMPIFLLLLLHYKKFGFYAFGAVTVASFIVPALIIGINDAYPASLLSLNSERSLQYSQVVYMMPYCRASPFFVGVWAGYFMWKNNQKKISLTPVQVAVGWAITVILMIGIIFGIYPYNYIDIPNPADKISTWYSILYGGLHRGLWGLCISWIILACQWGHGGVANSFLSHPGIQPLSRLTYCMYVISLPLQYLLIYSTIRPTYYSYVNKVMESCGVIFFSGFGALILSLTSEAPAINFIKMFK